MTATERKTLQRYLDLQYPVRFFPDPDGGYVAVFPDLPGCITQGETLAETAAMAEDARRGWIEVEYERGNDIPSPSYSEEHSGKFVVRLPRSLHCSLAAAAEDEGVSLNQYVVSLLSRGDAQARVERRLDAVESELHAIHARLLRSRAAQVPTASPEAGEVATRPAAQRPTHAISPASPRTAPARAAATRATTGETTPRPATTGRTTDRS